MRFVLIILVIFLSSCSLMPDWVGADNENKLEGERIAVLPAKSNLIVDPSLESLAVTLPPAAMNNIWLYPHFGQVYNLALPNPLENKDFTDIGSGPQEDGDRIISTPVIAKDIVYVLDGEGILTAREVDNISNILWEADLRTEEFDDGFFGFSKGMNRQKFLGGHISYADNVLFATTVAGDVIAFDARRGYEIWRRAFNLPIKSSPVAKGGALYFISINNQFYALDASNGKTLWTHAGITETTGVLGSPSPVVDENIVLVPYSSGEIYALNRFNGNMLWGDSLTALNMKNTTLFNLNDIDATPVIYDGVVYTVGHEGILTATELKTSKRIWEQEISSLETPWIAGNFLYILSTNDELICIYRPDGRIKWISPLPSFEDPDNHRDKINWSGPLLGGDTLYAVNSKGELWSFSPQDGKILNKMDVAENILLPPIVSGKKMYLLSNDAELVVLD